MSQKKKERSPCFVLNVTTKKCRRRALSMLGPKRDTAHLISAAASAAYLFTKPMTKKTKKSVRPPFKTHGGKRYLANWIISNFPEDYQTLNYCEPMCAGASVFLNKTSSPQEVINDLDGGVVAIFKALRDEPVELVEKLSKIKYCEESFNEAIEKADHEYADYMDLAVNEYVLRRMSRGGMRKAFAWSDRKRGGKPGDVNAWETMLETLPKLSERLTGVTILNKSVFDIFKVWDEENCLIYLDPPYLPDTRSEGSTEIYKYEMSADDHIHLLAVAKNARAKIIISGYPSPLYNRTLKGWKVRKKNVANNSSQSKKKERRVEVLWMNY